MTFSPTISRRAVLSGATGLLVSVALPVGGPARRALAASQPLPQQIGLNLPTSAKAVDVPTAYVHVGLDDLVTVIVKHIEFGQGPYTGLATLVAEELDADWSQMRAQSAPADAKLYGNDKLGGAQLTGGSTSMASSFDLMRRAGATARAMLLSAAATAWGLPSDRLTIKSGMISDPVTGRHGRFGEFAEHAASLPIPQEVRLKATTDFSLIGKERATLRLDTRSKVNGSAVYAIDIQEPGMLTVVVSRPPRFGGKPRSVDATAAEKVRGVVAVKTISTGFAVFADGTWPAIKGRAALLPTWDDTAAENRSSEDMVGEYLVRTEHLGTVITERGHVDAALVGSGERIEETFVFPFLAHAPMEPLDGVIKWDGRKAYLRYGCQAPSLDQGPVANVLGIEPSDVLIDTMIAGGSFGRRAQASSHLAIELAEVAKALGPGKTLKLLWTREDDLQGGCYRPMVVHRLKAMLTNGGISAWSNTLCAQSIFSGTPLEAHLENGSDPTMSEGSRDMPYRVEHFRCDVHKALSPITTNSWRSVGHSHTTYAVECFVDRLLQRLGKDPVEGRLELLADQPRLANVLRTVAKLANWTGPGPTAGRARGVAIAEAFGTRIAQIAEVSIGAGGEPVVHKIWCAVDCGIVVNPDVIRAQMEGGIGFALGHALFGEVPIERGAPAISNFNAYRSLSIDRMPDIEVGIVPSGEAPTGVGEPGVPAVAPAVANAMARLTGQRTTRLPFLRAA